MRLSALVAVAILALGEGGLCDRQGGQSQLFSGSVAGRAAALMKPEAHKPKVAKRQISFEGGGITIGGPGGLQLGGKGKGKGKGEGGAAGNQTSGGGGLSVGGIQLGGNKPAGGTGNGALDAFLNAANGAKKNGTANAGKEKGQKAGKKGEGGPGANPGEAAKAELGLGANPGEAAKQQEAAKEAERQGKGKGTGAGTDAGKPAGEGQKGGEARPGQPKAVEESEQFKGNAGITIGADGQVQNVGGNLGITKGSDGSTSVGGKSGINISPGGDKKKGKPAAPPPATEGTKPGAEQPVTPPPATGEAPPAAPATER
ncbi:hypothetical protein C8034_v006574 [Colletotrichum sidae]|uniref:Uncharacterized protein n=1 Tax=Colletotrichum sidae TaxID=1347389 RepID=A0A4R8T4X7_9PEZI|nr:hypothetical protein C8034_v006574 [Colletotrichum sidae]